MKKKISSKSNELWIKSTAFRHNGYGAFRAIFPCCVKPAYTREAPSTIDKCSCTHCGKEVTVMHPENGYKFGNGFKWLKSENLAFAYLYKHTPQPELSEIFDRSKIAVEQKANWFRMHGNYKVVRSLNLKNKQISDSLKRVVVSSRFKKKK